MNTLVCLENDAKGIVEAVKRKDVIIVIDALRCSSTIVTALANGAKSVIPVKSVSQARRLKKKHPDFLLAGERRGLKLNGFDFGNSPQEFAKLNVKGREIILTTTSGTKAILSSKNGEWVFIGSYLNASAVAETSFRISKKMNKGISLVLAGKRKTIFLEDFICAGAIAENFKNRVQLNDSIFAALLSYKASSMDLQSIIRQGNHAKYLESIGLIDDIMFSSRMNIFNVVPVLTGERIITQNKNISFL